VRDIIREQTGVSVRADEAYDAVVYDDDASETATLSGNSLHAGYTFPRPGIGRNVHPNGHPNGHNNGRNSTMSFNSNGSSSVSMIRSLSPDERLGDVEEEVDDDDPWTEQTVSSKEIESLFENMLNMKYGIHLCPSQFVLEMLERVFGFSRELETTHLTLAPAEPGTFKEQEATTNDMNPLTQAPGLILWPSTFIPMTSSDVEAHALRHSRTLLSCKTGLVEYAVEISGDEGNEVEVDGVMEALYEYEECVPFFFPVNAAHHSF
jgi:hypothetical protein